MDDYVRLINRTEDFINSHLDEKITISDLSTNVNLSKFHFHRIFSKFHNETLKQFIVRTKMERSAMFLLVRGDISITEIAFRYGYSESSAYSRTFKKYFGITPLEYRRARNVD